MLKCPHTVSNNANVILGNDDNDIVKGTGGNVFSNDIQSFYIDISVKVCVILSFWKMVTRFKDK